MRRILLFSAVALLPGCRGAPAPGQTPSPARTADVGILVMAHGGGAEWDRAIAEALEPVRGAAPTAVAFGMADGEALEAGLDSLAARGVRRVAVVRLFLSGRSFEAETRALLGLGRPAVDHHRRPVRAIDHGLRVATHDQGLLDSRLAAEVLIERGLSGGAARESSSLLLVAHGMGDDADDAAVLRAMDRSVEGLRRRGFDRVERVTLREDWPEKRIEAEERTRAFVRDETRAGRSVRVIPVRLFGFGPYAEILEGLEYEPTAALLPHPLIARWILETANEIACAEGWPAVTTPCPA